jgi:hypothetical protein
VKKKISVMMILIMRNLYFDFVQSKTHIQNRMDLKNLVREGMRWGISPRAGAALANAAFIDAKVITKENQKNIIDENKLKRQMSKYQEELREQRMKELKYKNIQYINI